MKVLLIINDKIGCINFKYKGSLFNILYPKIIKLKVKAKFVKVVIIYGKKSGKLG